MKSFNEIRAVTVGMPETIWKIGRSLILIFAVIILFLSSWYSVEQGDRALVLRFGKVIETTAPGLHFKVPIVDNIETISVRTKKLTNKLAVYSRDIQGAEVVLSINYSLIPTSVSDIYTKYGIGYEARVITPQIMSRAKDVFGQYNAVEIVQSRETLTAKVEDELQKQFAASGIRIESVQVENIDFSDEYERSVEDRMKAEVEVAKVRQNLEREKLNAEMVRTKAQGAADARIMQARAEAEAIRLQGEAEAAAIKARADALAKNQELVMLIQAEKWDGKLPQTMVPSGALPFLQVK
ncbi:MAG: prohibitin family protein [Desulfovibrio sp.]|jgi:regulator of protease activity HflC (stomatin/prohibitin superfamily)|nr:prohibitin family protein [Desulfovibrio sp.]